VRARQHGRIRCRTPHQPSAAARSSTPTSPSRTATPRRHHAHLRVGRRDDLHRQPFAEPEAIRAAHVYIGFAGGGAFADLETIIDAHHLTADEIVVEGRLCGRHVGEFQGFAPSGRAVELPYVGFYRFDADGGSVSERIVMNLGVLVA
jgi:hypothetical protein